MKRLTVWCGVIAWGLLGFTGVSAQDQQVAARECTVEEGTPQILTCEHRVPHISTVPANAGAGIQLSVRERVRSDIDDGNPRKAVLMIHGASVPVRPGFELRRDHYDWALWLAKQGGFDVFMLDFQGSGLSPRPKMDDPCNANPAQQSALIPNPLSATCEPIGRAHV